MYNRNGDSYSLQEIRYECRKRGNIPLFLRAFDRLPIISIQGWMVLPMKYSRKKKNQDSSSSGNPSKIQSVYIFIVPLWGLCLFVFLLICGIHFLCVIQWINSHFCSQGFGSKTQEPADSPQKKNLRDIICRSHTGFDFCYNLMSVLKSLSAIPLFPHLFSKVKFSCIITFVLILT